MTTTPEPADRLNAALGAAAIHLEAANEACALASQSQTAPYQQAHALTALAHVATGLAAIGLAFVEEEAG